MSNKPSRKNVSGATPTAARTAPLEPKALRFVLNRDHPSGVERIDWRGLGADAKETHYNLDRKQPIDSLRALAVAMLCLAHCRNGRGHELLEFGTVTVEKKRGGWEIRKVKPQEKGSSNWLQTLANGYEQRGEKNDKKHPTSPFGKLLEALPGLLNEQTRQWVAGRAGDSGRPRFWCHDYAPGDSSDYGGPKLLFRQVMNGEENADLPDATDWLALARDIEKAQPAWSWILERAKDEPPKLCRGELARDLPNGFGCQTGAELASVSADELRRHHASGFERSWMREEVAAFLKPIAERKPNVPRYLQLVAGPFFGKSWIAASLARSPELCGCRPVYHFFRRNQGALDSPSAAIAALCQQLRELHQLRQVLPELPPQEDFPLVLREVSQKLTPAQVQLIIVDGLDETFSSRGKNRACELAHWLPEPDFLQKLSGIAFFITTRPDTQLGWQDNPDCCRTVLVPRKEVLIQEVAEALCELNKLLAQPAPEGLLPHFARASEGLLGLSWKFHLNKPEHWKDWGEHPETVPKGVHNALAEEWGEILDKSAPHESADARMNARAELRGVMTLLALAAEPLSAADLGNLLNNVRNSEFAMSVPAPAADVRRLTTDRIEMIVDLAGQFFEARAGKDRKLLFFHTALPEILRGEGDGEKLLTVATREELSYWRRVIAAACEAALAGHRETTWYALRHLPRHLKEAGRLNHLYALAGDETFAQARVKEFPSEPELIISTVWDALHGAADSVDVRESKSVEELAGLALEHMRQVETLRARSPLEELRKNPPDLKTAIFLADQHPRRERFLWHLLMFAFLMEQGPEALATQVWFRLRSLPPVELFRGRDLSEAESVNQSAKKNEDADAGQRLHQDEPIYLSDWDGHLAAFALTRAVDINEPVGEWASWAASFLRSSFWPEKDSYGHLCRFLLSKGRVRAAIELSNVEHFTMGKEGEAFAQIARKITLSQMEEIDALLSAPESFLDWDTRADLLIRSNAKHPPDGVSFWEKALKAVEHIPEDGTRCRRLLDLADTMDSGADKSTIFAKAFELVRYLNNGDSNKAICLARLALAPAGDGASAMSLAQQALATALSIKDLARRAEAYATVARAFEQAGETVEAQAAWNSALTTALFYRPLHRRRYPLVLVAREFTKAGKDPKRLIGQLGRWFGWGLFTDTKTVAQFARAMSDAGLNPDSYLSRRLRFVWMVEALPRWVNRNWHHLRRHISLPASWDFNLSIFIPFAPFRRGTVLDWTVEECTAAAENRNAFLEQCHSLARWPYDCIDVVHVLAAITRARARIGLSAEGQLLQATNLLERAWRNASPIRDERELTNCAMEVARAAVESGVDAVKTFEKLLLFTPRPLSHVDRSHVLCAFGQAAAGAGAPHCRLFKKAIKAARCVEDRDDQRQTVSAIARSAAHAGENALLTLQKTSTTPNRTAFDCREHEGFMEAAAAFALAGKDHTAISQQGLRLVHKRVPMVAHPLLWPSFWFESKRRPGKPSRQIQRSLRLLESCQDVAPEHTRWAARALIAQVMLDPDCKDGTVLEEVGGYMENAGDSYAVWSATALRGLVLGRIRAMTKKRVERHHWYHPTYFLSFNALNGALLAHGLAAAGADPTSILEDVLDLIGDEGGGVEMCRARAEVSCAYARAGKIDEALHLAASITNLRGQHLTNVVQAFVAAGSDVGLAGLKRMALLATSEIPAAFTFCAGLATLCPSAAPAILKRMSEHWERMDGAQA